MSVLVLVLAFALALVRLSCQLDYVVATLPAVMWQEMQKINDSLVATIVGWSRSRSLLWAATLMALRMVRDAQSMLQLPHRQPQHLPHAIFDLCLLRPLLLRFKLKFYANLHVSIHLQYEMTDCSATSGVGVSVGGGNMRALSGASASDLLHSKHSISSLLEQHQQQELLVGRRNDASDGLISFINGE